MGGACGRANGPRPDRVVIGIDLGGTKVAAGVSDLAGSLLLTRSIPTRPEEGHRAVIQRFCDLALQLLDECEVRRADLAAVGLGTPGPVSHETGMVHAAPNLGWRNVPLRDLVVERLAVPCFVDNDANLAALGEWRFGAGRGTRHMVYVTWSTGIGGGLILNGELFHGVDNCAGEIGHIVVDPDGPVCGCGRRGCLEALASGTAIARAGAALVRDACHGVLWQLVDGDAARVSAREVSEAARARDPSALGVMKMAATYFGLGLSSVVNLLNPELIVVGGGVSRAYDLVGDVVVSTVQDRAVAMAAGEVSIALASLGSASGVSGAVAYALTALNTD